MFHFIFICVNLNQIKTKNNLKILGSLYRIAFYSEKQLKCLYDSTFLTYDNFKIK